MLQQHICPLCGSNEFKPYINTKDYFLTQEEFQIIRCCNCGFKLTKPKPEQSKIGDYYKSEEYISHNSNKTNFKTLLYKWARKRAVKYKIDIVKKYSAAVNTKATLLDIGCGTGYFLSQAKKKGLLCYGFEPIDEARIQAQKINPHSLIYDQQQFDLITQQFNVITMWHVLEHLYNLSEDLSKIIKLMQKNGVLIIAVPNPESFDAQYYREFWAAYDVPRHLYHFTKNDINAIAVKYNLCLTEVFPLKFDSYYVSLLSEKYKKSGTLMAFIKAIIIGWKSNKTAAASKSGLGYSSQVYVLKKQN